MIVDFIGCFIIEQVCKRLFANLEPKPMVTRGRERRKRRRAEEEKRLRESSGVDRTLSVVCGTIIVVDIDPSVSVLQITYCNVVLYSVIIDTTLLDESCTVDLISRRSVGENWGSCRAVPRLASGPVRRNAHCWSACLACLRACSVQTKDKEGRPE